MLLAAAVDGGKLAMIDRFRLNVRRHCGLYMYYNSQLHGSRFDDVAFPSCSSAHSPTCNLL